MSNVCLFNNVVNGLGYIGTEKICIEWSSTHVNLAFSLQEQNFCPCCWSSVLDEISKDYDAIDCDCCDAKTMWISLDNLLKYIILSDDKKILDELYAYIQQIKNAYGIYIKENNFKVSEDNLSSLVSISTEMIVYNQVSIVLDLFYPHIVKLRSEKYFDLVSEELQYYIENQLKHFNNFDLDNNVDTTINGGIFQLSVNYILLQIEEVYFRAFINIA